MPLPASVLHQFTKIPPNPSEVEFQGPYNKLLTILFPSDSRFTVIPQYMPSGSHESPHFIVRFQVVLDGPNRPVLVLELMPPSDFRLESRREAADFQIRQQLRDIGNDCPLPTLYGLSVMGTRLSFYSKERNGRVNPPRIIPDPDMTTNVAPQECWDHNILTEQGFQRFEDLVNDIKRGCEALPVYEWCVTLVG